MVIHITASKDLTLHFTLILAETNTVMILQQTNGKFTYVVTGTSKEPVYGKWVLVSNYDINSSINVTKMWHRLKAKIEEGREIAAIRMECPTPQPHKAPPEIHVYTGASLFHAIGNNIIRMVQHDINYIKGGGTFPGDTKTLCWNNGRPGYKDEQSARPEIKDNWRTHNNYF